MTITLVGLLAATSILAAETPRPIPADKQEEISRAMIAVQAADLQDLQGQLQATQLHDRAQAAHAKYEAVIEAARKQYGANGCDLSADKQWACPKEESKK